MKSVMQHKFSEVPRADIQRSTFNRSFGHKTSLDADYLVPVLVDDIIPGDTFNVKMNFFARLATPLHPIMDNMYLESFFFFVPYRLLWSNFEKFHGAQTDPGDSIAYTIPALSSSTSLNISVITGADYSTLANYFGFPPTTALDASEINVLPWRAYNLIWNEWFRDQNLQDSKTVDTDDGPDTAAQYAMLKRGKRHDYFTSALPWPQKGTAVDLPLGTSAPVSVPAALTDGNLVNVLHDGTYTLLDLADASHVGIDTASGGAANNLYADLSAATAATINDIRLAFQTQRLLERDARSGTRYVEILKSHWGVTSPDFRLQRPEFLGGGSSPVNINPVPNTAPVDSTNAPQGSDVNQGDLAAFGTVSGQHGFTQSFVEHGVLIGLVNIRGDITYSQGVDRYWTKSTRYDFFYPVLAQIGEQSILAKELYYAAADPEAVFGYQERYAEYRYKNSMLTGLFNVDVSGTLASWHLSEDFASEPTLDDTFIQSNTGTPLDRAIAVNTEPHFLLDMFFDMKCARPMPLFGVPGNLDRF